MREMSVAEQRYQAVLAVIGEGGTVTEMAWPVGCFPAERAYLAGPV
jgi:hypothetical protein